jgi:hypothetical protein
MDNTMKAALVAAMLAAASLAGPAAAGVGQSAARAAGDTAGPRAFGYGQTFDWHRPALRATRVKADPFDGALKLVVGGRSDILCSPAGAGRAATCRSR